MRNQLKRDCAFQGRSGVLQFAFVTVAVLLEPASANPQSPMAAKVQVTTVQSYNGSAALQKPERIVVYDFAVNPDDIQVDRSQSIRPRHILAGDQNASAIAKKTQNTYSKELMAELAKTGISVQHAEAGAQPPPNSLVVRGSFVSLKQGDKTERVALGFGTGTADVQTRVSVHLNTSGEACAGVGVHHRHRPGKECRISCTGGRRHEPCGCCGEIDCGGP